jgi:hypothetical protein
MTDASALVNTPAPASTTPAASDLLKPRGGDADHARGLGKAPCRFDQQ